MRVVGVDGARLSGVKGWVAVTLDEAGLREIAFHPTFAHLLDGARDADVIAVDIPIGHDDPEGKLRGGRRACDVAARELLGERAATIFLMPPPPVFDAPDHATACLLARKRGWIAPSAQVWNLRARILEVAQHAGDARIHEAHPELAFQTMKGAPLARSKKEPAGVTERLELLNREGLRPQRVTGGVGRLSPDDVLDATACAWVARRMARGEARRVPAGDGRMVAIWL